ncbi:hypothetical protein FEM48_Zijuj08G0140100 [Ziziphus jujuba var. spinosa]|uniref:oligopeptidase A n=1 Tax=Ziziphus jujuba var. spinosa TaxID=714518 RepID=A0A978UZI6_ZIZJJ|nr:hypothetical protein FEM48_Zijuj08G0140100 [Ziziphus jujuba var. spinosa]
MARHISIRIYHSLFREVEHTRSRARLCSFSSKYDSAPPLPSLFSILHNSITSSSSSSVSEDDLVELERTVEPSWPKLVEPLEKIVDRYNVVWGVISHLKSVKDSPDLRSAVEEVQPEKVKFQLRLGQSKPLYNAFKAIQESPDWQTLTDARKRMVECEYLTSCIHELGRLSQKFEENVLDATKRLDKLITDKKEIEGLPATTLGLAAQRAVSKGHEDATAEEGPWVITLDVPSYLSIMKHARNRTFREEVYHAYVTRASNGDLDNASIIDQLLKLRLEKAKLLGYNNYAEQSMATKMATVEKAEELLEKLRSACWDAAVQVKAVSAATEYDLVPFILVDVEELRTFAKKQGAPEADDLNHWDINFWSDRLRESKLDINEEELRPYFSLPKVMNGLFNLAKMLFGIEIEPADGLAPVWNNDVNSTVSKTLQVVLLHTFILIRILDRQRNKVVHGWVRLLLEVMPCRAMVETVFHEFGHALQHMLTKQDEGLVAGFRGIEWDAVELPSQFMENWCYHRDTLMSIARHYETGECLPEGIFLKVLAARTFRAGSQFLRQIRFASVDLELHTKYVPGGSESIYDIDRRVSAKTQVILPLPEDRFLCSFSHIFAGGYAAGYYSYKTSRYCLHVA